VSTTGSSRSGDLALIDEELASKPYLGGFAPSARDASTFAAVIAKHGFDEEGVVPANTKRWLQHIASFSNEVRGSWK
jgi:hypothetical protein